MLDSINGTQPERRASNPPTPGAVGGITQWVP